MSSPPTIKRKLLKRTTSRCPLCFASAPAEVLQTDESPSRILLSRTCPEHGQTSVCISSDARFYWLSRGSEVNRDPDACGAGCACAADPGGRTGTLGKNAFADKDATVEKLSTCLALIEIVDSCNLTCPTCYADSPVGTNGNLQYHPLASLQERIGRVIERKGHIEILQLSGGEPTLHPEFFEILDWCHAHPDIDYVLINTNGVRIAKDDEFLDGLRHRAPGGHLQLYLQFDGPQEAGQAELRGSDLREVRKLAMERCAFIGLPVTLAMTVTGRNLPHLWDTIAWGLHFENCRGVSFQPLFHSGRLESTSGRGERQAPASSYGPGVHAPAPSASFRLNTADLILAVIAQSEGQLGIDDFTPLPCGDPNCATIGYLLRTPNGVRSISEFVDFQEVQGFLRDKVRYQLEDLRQCGCDNTALGELLRQFELREKDTFRLFIKPFMDAWSWDEDRIDRCCTHVIRPDGSLDSFCRYYSGFADCGDRQTVPEEETSGQALRD